MNNNTTFHNCVLSVVVPSYNMEKYIRKGLERLLAAKHKEKMEIIVINDGSTDHTLEIAEEYHRQFPDTVKIINKSNEHYGSCINAALKVARGKYFRIMDADDWFETKDVDEFIGKLAVCNSDLVVTFRVEIKTLQNGKTVKEKQPVTGVEYGKEYDATKFRFLQHAHGNEFNMHGMTYKTSLLKSVGLKLPVGICYTDLLYCFLPLNMTKTLTVFDIYLYNYRLLREGSSTSKSSLAKNLWHISIVINEMFRYLEREKPFNAVVKENLYKYVEQDAFGVLLACLQLQLYVGNETFLLLKPILEQFKIRGLRNGYLDRYYFHLWEKYNTRLALNASLLINRIVHPKYWR